MLRSPAGADDSHRPAATTRSLFTFVSVAPPRCQCEGRDGRPIGGGDSFVVPAGVGHMLLACSEELEILEVFLPARFVTIPHSGEASPAGISSR